MTSGQRARGAGVSLVASIPAVDEFPIATWERLRAQVLAKKGVNLLRYASNRGDADLRKAIAAYLCDFRAARCHPDQIVIVAGMQQAMLISAMAVLNPGQAAWVEDPCYQQIRRVLTLAGVKIVPKPLDNQGIVIARSPRESLPRLIYVTPSHQFPLGVTMSFQRRTGLLDFARAHNVFIFEDDYDSEFRFVGPPLPSLQGIDNSSRVIYAGTVSKILCPSLRLGYIVAPEPLVDSLVKIRSAMDQHSSPIAQATLARFITEGFFLSHIKRMRKTLPKELMGMSQFRMAMAWQRTDSPEQVKPWFLRDDPSFQIIPELAPRPTEGVFDKLTMSAFEGTWLDFALRDCGVNAFIIVGVATEIGIEPTARHGADLGYIPVLITDACGSGNEAAAKRSVESLQFSGDALLTETETVCDVLRRRSKVWQLMTVKYCRGDDAVATIGTIRTRQRSAQRAL